jgi:hypothetical protein
MAGRPSPAVAHRRAVVGGIACSPQRDQAALDDAHRALRAELLAEHVERVVNELPPLTDEQIERIAALLRAGAT